MNKHSNTKIISLLTHCRIILNLFSISSSVFYEVAISELQEISKSIFHIILFAFPLHNLFSVTL